MIGIQLSKPADFTLMPDASVPKADERGITMLNGTMVSERIGNARIWTLTVSEYPRPGQLIEWSEPECGLIPARSGIRGWISSSESTYPGTVLVTVATESTRWVIVNVK